MIKAIIRTPNHISNGSADRWWSEVLSPQDPTLSKEHQMNYGLMWYAPHWPAKIPTILPAIIEKKTV